MIFTIICIVPTSAPQLGKLTAFEMIIFQNNENPLLRFSFISKQHLDNLRYLAIRHLNLESCMADPLKELERKREN